MHVARWHVLAAWVVAGCGGEGAESGAAPMVRDSSGVEIVESARPAWTGGAGWAVPEEPALRLGALDGAEPFTFHDVRDATRHPDGTLVVADAGSSQLRVYEADGAHRRTLGGPGQGPGEFRSLRTLWLEGDTLFVFDDHLLRITKVDLGGGVAGTRPVQMAAQPSPMAIADVRSVDGRLFGMDGSTFAQGLAPAVVRDTAYVFEIGPDGAPSGPVTKVGGRWTEHLVLASRSVFRHQALTPAPSWDAGGGRLFLCGGDRFEFVVADLTGRTVRVVRRQEPPPPTTAAHVQGWKDALLEGMPAEQRALAAPTLEELTMPTTIPAYAALVLDAEGHVWANRYVAPGLAPGPEWDVYASSGQWLGGVRTPPGLSVFEIGSDYVLGRWVDPLGVEYVQLHTLRR